MKNIILTLPSILIIVIFAAANIIAQNSRITTSEVPQISAGAEYYLQVQKHPDKFRDNFLEEKQNKNLLLKQTGIITSFDAINFDGNIKNTGYLNVPPDPIAAAGPNHLVNVVNTSIEWFTKTGQKMNSESLKNFFNPLSPLTGMFDPKVIYDQYNNRFIIVALEQTDVANGASGNTSKIYIAVSDDDDPNGIWYFHAIDSKINFNGIDHWADYPGLAVGTDAIYITANEFKYAADGGNYGASYLWIVNKNPFYSGGSAVVNYYNAPALAGIKGTTMQPAHMFNSPPSNVGTFLVSYSGLHSGADSYLSIITVENPLSSPTFTNTYAKMGVVDNLNIDIPGAPQLGTSELIETNDRRALNAVFRNNNLWVSTTVTPPSGADINQATAFWAQLNTSDLNNISASDFGTVGGEDIATGAYTFFPSIAVDKDGNMGIAFAATAPTIYPGAYFTGRLSSDPAGTVRASQTLAAGVDYYIRKLGSTRNRWGDYSGLSVSPDDDQTFWAYNEYALSRGTVYNNEDGRWGTRYGSFVISSSPLPPVFTSVMPDQAVNEGSDLQYIYRAYDPNVNSVEPVYSLVSKISHASIDSIGGLFSFSPDFNQAGVYNVIVRASNPNNPSLYAQDTALVTVNNINRPPFFSSIMNDTTITDGTDLRFQYSASDPDNNDKLTFQLINPPGGAFINPSTGQFEWTPVFEQQGKTYTITVRVFDNGSPVLYADTSSTVAVNPSRKRGDVDNDGKLLAADADMILKDVVGIITLSTPQELYAADAYQDGVIRAYDAYYVLYAVVHQDTFPDGSIFKAKAENGQLKFGCATLFENAEINNIPISISGSDNIYSIKIKIDLKENDKAFKGLKLNLPRDWHAQYLMQNGFLTIALSGLSRLPEENIIALSLGNIKNAETVNISGNVSFNDNNYKPIDSGFSSNLPLKFNLMQNYPNPFNPETKISFTLPSDEIVELNIYDMLGNLVASLVHKNLNAGQHTFSWIPKNQSSGIYYCTLKAGSFSKTMKMIYLK